MRFCNHLLLFSKVRGLRKGHLLGTIFGDHLGDKIIEIRVQVNSKKVMNDFWVHFGDHWVPLGHPLERNE